MPKKPQYPFSNAAEFGTRRLLERRVDLLRARAGAARTKKAQQENICEAIRIEKYLLGA